MAAWEIVLAAVFFVAGLMMIVVGFFLTNRTSTARVSPQDQALLIASGFILAGILLLFLYTLA